MHKISARKYHTSTGFVDDILGSDMTWIYGKISLIL